MEQPSTKYKCQQMYLTLLNVRSKQISAPILMQEIIEVVDKCKSGNQNLFLLEERLERKLLQNYDKMRHYSQIEDDGVRKRLESIAEKHLLHYSLMTNTILRESLNWKSCMIFYKSSLSCQLRGHN